MSTLCNLKEQHWEGLHFASKRWIPDHCPSNRRCQYHRRRCSPPNKQSGSVSNSCKRKEEGLHLQRTSSQEQRKTLRGAGAMYSATGARAPHCGCADRTLARGGCQTTAHQVEAGASRAALVSSSLVSNITTSPSSGAAAKTSHGVGGQGSRLFSRLRNCAWGIILRRYRSLRHCESPWARLRWPLAQWQHGFGKQGHEHVLCD